MPQITDTKLKPLTFISVEGFWEKTVHDARVAEAAEKMYQYPDAFAIATATYPPAQCTCFTKDPLGQYSAQKLIKDYKITPERIIPAYLLPQKTTYTIIDAYSNAIMIGWLCSGLTVSPIPINTSLHPVSAGFRAQQKRIMLLNTRATKVLEKLSVKVILYPASSENMSFEQIAQEDQEEAQKLMTLEKPNSVLYTGTWPGNSGTTRAFDDINAMKNELIQALDMQTKFDVLFSLSNVERLLLTMIWNVCANIGFMNHDYLDKLCEFVSIYFIDATNTNIQSAKNELIAKKLLPI